MSGHAHDFGDHLRETSVLADFNKPLIARTTRWDYLNKHVPLWKSMIRYRLYFWICIAIAAYGALAQPLLIIPGLAGIGYYYILMKMVGGRIASSRKVIIGH